MAKILGIGIAAVDIINMTRGYPNEDSEVRAENQLVRRGGNVTNTLVVLSQLGHECQWLGNLANDTNSQIITRDLDDHKIDYFNCPRIPHSISPTSYITLNMLNGSRTIVHYRQLAELSADSLDKLPLSETQWIHFEGRNTIETRKMLDFARQQSPRIILSVEIEKPRAQLELLFTDVDYYFFSKAFAESQHFDSAVSLLEHYRAIIPTAVLICTWGSNGAYALHYDSLLHAPAIELPTVVDSIGAGDTFIAGFIDARLRSSDVSKSLEFACNLAANKCSVQGLDDIRTPATQQTQD